MTIKYFSAVAAAAALSFSAHAALVEIDVDESFPPDVTLAVDLNAALGTQPGGEVYIDAIGWDVEVTAVDPAWASDAVIDFGGEVTLTPCINETDPGTFSCSSGGLLDLVGLNLDFSVADGILNLTFFDSEGFADLEGLTMTGTLSLNASGQAIPPSVPEPATLALLLLGGLGSLFASRKR